MTWDTKNCVWTKSLDWTDLQVSGYFKKLLIAVNAQVGRAGGEETSNSSLFTKLEKDG